jgi:N-glycosylase/DNA lyase
MSKKSGMNKLLEKIQKLKLRIGKNVKDRLKEFEKDFYLAPEQKFLELCFCILVANSSMEKTLEIWEKIGTEFLNLSERDLKKKLKNFGYRFYNKRAEYIVEARKIIPEIEQILKSKREEEIREWLAENIKGIGWKEASHFLRNLGFKNFAILDRHVLKILYEHEIINEIPKTLAKNKYLEIEGKLKSIAKSLNITQAELDLYLFYLDTGKICKK